MEVVFYEDRRGRKPAQQYLDGLEAAGELSMMAAFVRGAELLEEFGPAVRMPNARIINRRDRIYELRFGDHRIAYVEHGGCIVLLHGWRKRGQKLDTREEARALAHAADWRERNP